MGFHELGLLILLLVIIGVFVLWLTKQLSGPIALVFGMICLAVFFLVGVAIR